MKNILFLIIFLGTLISTAADKNNLCPMVIVPGKSMGPLHFLTNLISVQNLFPNAKTEIITGTEKNGKFTYVEHKGLHISFCNEQPQDIWIDLQKIPKNCLLQYNGKKFSSQSSVSKIKKIFGGCEAAVYNEGGTFYECQTGLRIGISSINKTNKVDQIRIGSTLNPKCLP